jgi:hypothetical protein
MRNIWLHKPTNKRYILIFSLEKLNEYAIPPFKSLRVFESAGRNLRFTLAAEDLNVTPGAISQQIRQLEDFLEVKLFKRWQMRAELAGLCKFTVVFGTHDA